MRYKKILLCTTLCLCLVLCQICKQQSLPVGGVKIQTDESPLVEHLADDSFTQSVLDIGSFKAAWVRRLYRRLEGLDRPLEALGSCFELGKKSEGASTFTGLAPLRRVSLSPPPENGYSKTEINHSYGAAKNGEPHELSKQSQALFDREGFAAMTYDKTAPDKLYLSFDCGYENGCTAEILDILKEKGVKATFFCTLHQIKENPSLTARMINEGHLIGNHSSTHCNFALVSNERISKELEDFENYLRENFGCSTRLFRFPEGAYSLSALKTVNELGYYCCFWSLSYADWDVNNQRGKDFALEKLTSRLHGGAVILLHSVSSDNRDCMAEFIDYARAKGYEFASLETAFE